ncbi:MAG: hypothetical protein PHI85_09325 [Victivallaceae bacterium]|nr:hypothetical protein [Victivallaceae bacterium]
MENENKSPDVKKVPCQKCKKNIEKGIRKCPFCGAPQMNAQVAIGCVVILIIIIISIFCFWGHSDNDKTIVPSPATIDVQKFKVLSVNRYNDVDTKKDVINLTIGADYNHQFLLVFSPEELFVGAKKLQHSETCQKYDESIIKVQDGDRYFGIFPNTDTYVAWVITNLDRQKQTATIKIKFRLLNAIVIAPFEYKPGEYVIEIEDEFKISGDNFNIMIEPTVDHLKLEIGKSYFLSAETVLSPEVDPADPISAMKKMKKIAPNTRITVNEIEYKSGSPWYFVDVNTSSGQSVSGWINSAGLIAQRLKIADQ